MSSIGLLHLTDFHQGMGSQRTLWPNVKESFLDDLERLHRKAGPWDAIVFTGDLTQRGSHAEFVALDQALDAIIARLEPLGSKPVVLAVPGNHDLQRPAGSETLEALAKWHDDDATPETFFDDPGCAVRKLVDAAFLEYVRWWNARVATSGLRIRHGILPGDFGVTLEKNGLRLALVGLNSSFLQLRDRMREGELDVAPRQLHSLGADVPEWLRSHHAALLLTHHPLDWLHQNSQTLFRDEIDRPGRFVAHLFGHMHEAAARVLSEGGAPPRRGLQGLSLFGLETIDAPTGKKIERLHGYAALRVSVRDSQGELALWPRSYELNRLAGYQRMVPDHGRYDLENEAALWHFTPLLPFASPSPPAPPAADSVIAYPQPTGALPSTPSASNAAGALQVLSVEGTVSMSGNSDVQDGRFSVQLVVRLSALVSTVHITSIDLSCVNERGLWAWSQEQLAFVDSDKSRATINLISYTNLAGALQITRGGCLLSIERTFKPRLSMQYPYEWDQKRTCFVLDLQWLAGDGQQQERFCFEWQGARAIKAVSAPRSPPRLDRAELSRLHEQGFLNPDEQDALLSVGAEERYLLLCYSDHYRGRYRPEAGPAYDTLLKILSDLHERLSGHPPPPLAPCDRSHRAEFTLPAHEREVALPMSPARPETLRVTSYGVELSFSVEGAVVRLVEALSFDVTIVVTWIE